MAGILTLQGKITTTGTAQQLPANVAQFSSFTLTAKSTNTAPIAVTPSASGGAVDGTGAGYILEAGKSVVVGTLGNTSAIWLTGTSGDIFSAAAGG